MGPERKEELAEQGVRSVQDFLDVDPSEMATQTSMSEEQLRGWKITAHPKSENPTTDTDGVGPVTERRLEEIGVSTLADLAQVNPNTADDQSYLSRERLGALRGKAERELDIEPYFSAN